MSRMRFVIFVLALILPLAACAEKPITPEDALIKLEELNAPYTSEEFVRRARRGHSAAVDLFLAAGMEVDVKDEEDRTALWNASEIGHTAIVKTLLGRGQCRQTARGE